jgi:hypothetical protein
MNLLTMVTLAVLVPGAGAETENAEVWVRVTSNHLEVFTTPKDAEAVQQKGEEGIWVKCKSLKINFTAEGNVIECEGCNFTWGEGKGTAHSIVFDQGKNTVKFKGKENTPVQWTYHSEKNGELKFVGEFEIEILRPETKSTTGVSNFDETDESSLDRFRRRYTQSPQNDKDF